MKIPQRWTKRKKNSTSVDSINLKSFSWSRVFSIKCILYYYCEQILCLFPTGFADTCSVTLESACQGKNLFWLCQETCTTALSLSVATQMPDQNSSLDIINVKVFVVVFNLLAILLRRFDDLFSNLAWGWIHHLDKKRKIYHIMINTNTQ